MKILLTGDWHYTDKTPDCRIDDYQQTEEDKIQQILELAQTIDSYVILQAGDMTDTPFLSYSTYIRLSELLKETNSAIFTVYGQHDLRYRNKGNTPLDALVSRGLLAILTKEPAEVLSQYDPGAVDIYGCSFGEPHPVIKNPSKFNILVLHQLILSSQEKEWEKDQVLHSSLLNNSEYDLIVSGDNHKPFIINTKEEKTRHLVNCGSLMRSTIDQIDHKPFVVIFDTENRTFEKHFLKIKPWGEVFDLERKVKKEILSEELELFGKSLTEQKDMGLDYVSNLTTFMEENSIDKSVKEIVSECVTE